MRKSILAIAISAAAMAFAAQTVGQTIDLSFINETEGSRKLVDSSKTDDDTLEIKLDSDFRQLLSDLADARGNGISAYINALSQMEGGKHGERKTEVLRRPF